MTARVDVLPLKGTEEDRCPGVGSSWMARGVGLKRTHENSHERKLALSAFHSRLALMRVLT